MQRAIQSRLEMREYLAGLIAERRASPKDDLLSGLVVGDDPAGRMDERELLATAGLLLVAGHETTVNLITNGTLTLLRHPDALERLRRAPDLVVPLVEEVLRYDPPVQFRTRTTVDDIDIAGVTIPKGASVVLAARLGQPRPGPFPRRRPVRSRIARTTNTSASAAASTTASAAPSAGPRRRSRWASSSAGWRTRAWSRTRRPTGTNAALRGPRHLLVDVDGIR